MSVLLAGMLALQSVVPAYAGEEAIIIEETAEPEPAAVPTEEAPVQAAAETVMETPAAETGQEAPAEPEIQETAPETQPEAPAVTEAETQETPDGTQDQTGEAETGTDAGTGQQTETETQPVTEPGWQDMTPTEAPADTEVQSDAEGFGTLETETGTENTEAGIPEDGTEPEDGPETETETGTETETETEEFTDAEPQSFTSTSLYIPDAGSLPGSDELFAGYAWNILYGGGGISLFGNYGESVLNETELAVYNELKTAVGKIAAGEVSSTDISITCISEIASWVTENGNNLTALRAEADQKLSGVMDTDKIVDCLLADCPYELYWYDKTSDGGVDVSFAVRTTTGTVDGVSTTTATISGLKFSFAVTNAYQSGNAYVTDTAKTGAASAAAATARQVVANNAGKTDYAKLVAYKDYICNAVSYNSDAASGSYTGGYGDPWQIIYVFDGDSSTNVVCEGYAKAFQYLCDLGGLTCYTVTGTMTGGTGAGEHMWNIVTMEDGKNYLVDVTNSDTGTVGQDGSLFLAGTSGSVADGYTFGSVSFTYDDDTKSLYGDSILTLAAEDYTEPVTKENGVAEVVIGNGNPTYYKTITEAFAAVQSGDTATITLLRDAPVESGKITVNGDVTLVGGDHTISGTYSDYGMSGLINIPSGAKLTITSGIFANSSSAFSQIYTVHVNGGTLVIGGGTITATCNNDATAVRVYSGSAEISGGTFTGTASGFGSGYGVYVNTGSNAELTGGTFTGSYSAVNVISGNVGNLLENGYIYCKDGVYVSGDSNSLGSGTYTVDLCVNHSWGAWSDAGDGTHIHACEYCGQTEGVEHTCENGFCAVCGGYEAAVWNESAGRYEISSGGQLFWFAELVNGKADGENSTESNSGNNEESGAGNGTGSSAEKNPAANAVLTADIDLESRPWTAIGSEGNAYTGTFDGGGHTVSGLSITASGSNQGLFGYCGGAIQNLTVRGSIVITGDASGIGGIVGYLGGGTVSNAVSTVNIFNSAGAVAHVGGVAGALYDNARLSHVENHGNVTTSGSYDCIGGMAGYMWASTIEYSINLGAVSAGGSDAYVGGITGYSNTSRNTIRSCYNYGPVSSGGGTYCGAVIGWLRDGKTVLENCCYLEGTAGSGIGTNAGTGSAWSLTAKEFASGKAAWLLNGGSVAEDGTVTDPSGSAWGQTLPGNSLPVLGGAAVYRYESCDGVEGFTNDSGQAGKWEHQFDADYRCTVCGQQMVARVTADEKTAYYTDIAEAFKDAGTAGNAAVVTLLADAQASETLVIPEGSSITLTCSEGNTYTISGDVSAADSGLIDVRGGSFTFAGGTVRNGTGGTNAIAVNGGSFLLAGGTVVAEAEENSGVCVYSGTAKFQSGSASGYNGLANVGAESFLISGGTYTGTFAAVLMRSAVEGTVKSLLDVEKAKAYYKDTIAPENLITDLGGKTLPAGTVMVGDCTHSYDTWTDKNDGEHHRRSCVVCGLETEEDHTWDENGKCTAEGCEAEGSLVAAVTADEETAYYTDLDKAWTAARSAGAAEVLLLKSVERRSSLPVQSGEDITLAMAEGVVLSSTGNFVVNISYGGSVTMRSGSVVGHGVYGIWVYGSFTLEDGSIACESGSGIYVSGTWGNAVLNGGRVSGKNGLYVYGLSDAAGATVQGADISASQYGVYVMEGSARIESGSVSGESRGVNVVAGTAYLNGGTVSSLGTGAYVGEVGKIEINGSTVSGKTGVYAGGWGVRVLSGTITGEETGMLINGYSSRISGGTIRGGTYSVYCQADTILSETLADYHFYYAVAEDGSQTLISDAAVLGGRELSAESGYGTITVKECTHSYGDWTDNEDGSAHSRECEICGYTETGEHSGVWTDEGDGTCSGICDTCGASLGTEAHTYGDWTDNRNGNTHSRKCENCGHEETEAHTWDENGSCTVCGAVEFPVSVTADGQTEYFTNIMDAWAAAKAKNSPATVTLLSDVTAAEPLTVEAGDEIILESGMSAGGWYCISGAFDTCGTIQVSGGSFTMNGGRLCNISKSGGYARAYDLQVSGGTAVVNNGEFVDGGYGYTYGMYITGGVLEVYDCTITVKWNAINAIGGGDVWINGGTITGANCGINASRMGSNGKLWITGGKISSSGAGVSVVNSAVEITGGEITGDLGVSALSNGVLTVSGGKISGTRYGLYASRISADSRLTGGTFTGGTGSMYVDSGGIGASVYSLVRENGDYYYYAVDDNGNETQIPPNEYPYSASWPGVLYASDGYGTVTVKNPDEVAYTITIPKTAAAGGEAVSVGINTEQTFNLNGGTVSVSVSGGIDSTNGKLTLTNTEDAGSAVTSALYVQKQGEEEKPVTEYADLTFAEFTKKNDPAVSLSFKEPEEINIPAGNYEGTITFSIDYTAAGEGGTTE